MKNTLMNIVLAGMLAGLPLAANAQLDPPTSCEQVENMLAAGTSAADVVTAMKNTGMALTGATVFAMECASAEYKEAIVEAGVGLAATIIEANSVVRAVALAAGDSAPETVAARKAQKQYEKMAKQPDGYKGKYDPQGSGSNADISPS